MRWRQITKTIFEFFKSAISPMEVNAYYYSGKKGCTGIYYKDKEEVLKITTDAKCKSCGAKVADHNLS